LKRDGLSVLISGAGIAGATLAALLGRAGHGVTVVERDQGVRSSGNPVDVRKGAYQVAERLGVLSRLQDAATRVRELIFVDDDGRRVASMRTRQSDREVEVPRADLSAILIEAGRADAEFLFDEMITELHPDDGGVEVIFDRAAAPRRFDLVVGADGIYSGSAAWPSDRKPTSSNLSECMSPQRHLVFPWSAMTW